MRLRLHLVSALVASLALATSVTACGGDDTESYANLEECVTDHTVNEGLTEAHAITTCLHDHLDVTFDTVQECVDYVTNNGGYPDSRDAACADLLSQPRIAP